MKQLLAAMLLVTVVGLTGCGDTKKPAAKTTPATGDAAKPADTAKPADPAKAP
jgi:hypothetical protein